MERGGLSLSVLKKVAEIHAEELTKTVSSKEPFQLIDENYREDADIPTAVGESAEEKYKDIKIDYNLIKKAIGEMTSSKSKDSNGIGKETLINIQESFIPSLVKLGNLTFKKGKVPEYLKTVHITAIPKGAKSDEASGVRPINLTSNILKIWERVVKLQIYPYLEGKEYFSTAQHGFRKNRSTSICLGKIMNVIQRNIKRGVHLVGLDFSKTFDVLDHEIMVQELKNAGFSGKAFQWISNWLVGNEFQCRIKDSLSKARKITTGCRQGSTLGPLLFLIFINSLLRKLPERMTFCYADNVMLVVPFTNAENKNANLLQNMLDICTKWSNENGLKFNVKKCHRVNLGQR